MPIVSYIVQNCYAGFTLHQEDSCLNIFIDLKCSLRNLFALKSLTCVFSRQHTESAKDPLDKCAIPAVLLENKTANCYRIKLYLQEPKTIHI